MAITASDLAEMERRIAGLPPDKLKEIIENPVIQAEMNARWKPAVGNIPQQMAYNSKADVMLYGGQAGGGKTGLCIGLALTQHKRSLIMRREYGELSGLIEDCLDKYGSREGYSGQSPPKLRTDDGRLIEFGGAKDPGDEQKWKGQAHDLLAIDEASAFLESQVRYLMGWVRSDDPNQRCRVVLATNPPEKPGVGQYLIDMFAPWLKPGHPLYIPNCYKYGNQWYGRKAGELMWVITNAQGKDEWVDGPEPVEINGETYHPTSRTFIPARLEDNPYLYSESAEGKKYKATLDGLPEPLRSAVRNGNWTIAHKDDEWQVIPTAWIMTAQDRWTEDGWKDAFMTALALDCSGDGPDPAVLCYRHGSWFGPLVSIEGNEKSDGVSVMAHILRHRKNGCAIALDADGGWASGVIEHLKQNGIEYSGFKGSNKSSATALHINHKFVNRRAEALWRLREALDPEQEGGSQVALPPDTELLGELAAARWTLRSNGILIREKQEIKKLIGRSPNKADAVMMCLLEGDRMAVKRMAVFSNRKPVNNVGYSHSKRRIGRSYKH